MFAHVIGEWAGVLLHFGHAYGQADGKPSKRPILDTGTTVLVGFDEAKYETELA